MEDIVYPSEEDIADDLFPGLPLDVRDAFPSDLNSRERFHVSVYEDYSRYEGLIGYVPVRESCLLREKNLQLWSNSKYNWLIPSEIVSAITDEDGQAKVKIRIYAVGSSYSPDLEGNSEFIDDNAIEPPF